MLLRYRPSIAMQVLLKDLPVALVRKVGGRVRRLYRGMKIPVTATIDQHFPVGDPD